MNRTFHRPVRLSVLALVALAQRGRGQGADTSCTSRPATSITGTSPAIAPIDVANNHVYVKVCVGDRPLDFILDSGAGATFFDLDHAKQLGLKLGSAFTARGAGAGTIAGAQVGNGGVTLAGTGVRQNVTAALDLSRLPSREAHAMDGILGFDFISRYVVAIDYVKHELRLYDRDSFVYSGPGTSLPVTFVSNHPHVDAEVRLADGQTIKGRMIVDVGASSSLSLTKPWVDDNHLRERITPTIHRRGGGGVGGMTSSDIGRVAALRLGNIELMNPTATLYGDSAGVFTERGSWIANIGGDVLRRFTVFLDYKHRRMILEPHAGTNEPFEADMSGAGLIMDDSLKNVIADYVIADSPAGAAGLAAKDTIVSFDGKPADMRELRAFRQRVKHEGVRVTLSVRRGGETKTVAFVTRRLI